MSKKAAKRTKAATALPLVSPHWWSREQTVAYCRAHKGEIADGALTAAVNAGDLPVKLEWIDHQTSSPVQHKLLLSAEDYAFGPYISSNFLVIQPRRPDVPPLPRPHALFFWGPKAKELSGYGVARMPGSTFAYQNTDGSLEVTMTDGKPSGWTASGHGIVTLATGNLASLNGKKYEWTGKGTGPNVFEADFTFK